MIFKENIKNYLASIYYRFSKKNITSRGYERFKQSLIKKIIDGEKTKLISYFDERIVEIPWIIKELKKKRGKLLDAGSTLNYKYLLENLSHLQKIFISTLYPEKNYYNNLNVSYTYEDMSELSFKDQYFDIVTSISTLEHIDFNNNIYNYGGFKYKKKIKSKLKVSLLNLKRVLKKNGKLLVTIPYGKQGYYDNMQQFDKKSLKKILVFLKMKKIDISYYKYSRLKWKKTSANECHNIKPNIKKIKNKKIVLSANSIALIKMIK